MAILLPSGKFSSETFTGAPLVGGKVYAYVPNTSTPKDTYTSVTESVQNPHPVILDARGEATIYWSGSYDVILKDANGVTIWGPERLQETGSADDLEERLASTASAVDGPARVGWSGVLAYSGGASTTVGGLLYTAFGRTAAEISAGVTPTNYAYPVGNIQRYGADASGATSSSAALLAASQVSKYITAWAGSFHFATDVAIAQADTTIQGPNPESCVFTYTKAGAGTFITFAGGFNHIEGIGIYGNGSTVGAYFTASQIGVEIVGNLTMSRCQVRHWEKAIDQASATGFYLYFENVQTLYNKYCYYGLTSNNTEFNKCRAAFCDYVVLSGGGDGPIAWVGGSIENVTTAGFALLGGNSGSIGLHGAYIENVGALSTAGTGLAAAGYTAATLVLGNWNVVGYYGCDGQIGGFFRVTDVTTATRPNVVSTGNQWTYKLDAGVSDTQYIHAIGDGGDVIVSDRSTGRSDTSYTPSATYTIAGLFLTSYTGGMAIDPVSHVQERTSNRAAITYSASMTPDATTATQFSITATNGTAFTINAPTNPKRGGSITVTIRNTSGGALGAATWDAVFKMAAWVQPGNGFSATIEFQYNGTNWVEVNRGGVTVPN